MEYFYPLIYLLRKTDERVGSTGNKEGKCWDKHDI